MTHEENNMQQTIVSCQSNEVDSKVTPMLSQGWTIKSHSGAPDGLQTFILEKSKNESKNGKQLLNETL